MNGKNVIQMYLPCVFSHVFHCVCFDADSDQPADQRFRGALEEVCRYVGPFPITDGATSLQRLYNRYCMYST